MDCGGEWKPIAVMVAINFALGMMNALVKKTLDGGVDHMIVATYRLAIAAIFLAPIAYFWERKNRPKLTSYILCQLFFSALLGSSLSQYCFLLGLAHTSATLSCAFLSITPAITFILTLIFRLETVKINSKAGGAKVVGTLVCIGGALFLTLYKGMPVTSHHSQAKLHQTTNHAVNSTNKKTENWAVGSALLLAGCILWCLWLLVQARINKRYPCHYSNITIMSCFGTFQSALLSLIKQRDPSKWLLTKKFDIITIVYAGVIGQGVCNVGMSWCIKQKGPLFTSTLTPLMLIFATVFDFFALKEPIYLGSVLGSLFVIFGLYIFLWGKSKDTEEVIVKPTQEAEEDEERCHSVSI